MSDKQKILLCGDVEGKFKTLFNRVENINKKSGPFDLLLCVGNFFGINNVQFDAYKSGESKVPVPTYILGPNKQEHDCLYPKDDEELCENVYYLGKRGLYTSCGGLKIAYLSGISAGDSGSPCNHSNNDIKELHDVCVRGKSTFKGVDVLLTSQWPANINNNTGSKNAPQVNFASDLPAWLLLKLKPRYHVSGLEGVFYERPPFRCPDLTGEGIETVTRFIGLARVGNEKKDKWIYALNIKPLEKMQISELLQKTTDETTCPFDIMDVENRIFKTKRKAVSSNQYFYDTSEPEPDKKSKRKRQNITFDQSKCWFCLGSQSVEKHLIVSVGDCSYLTLAKGGVVDEHFLICPIEHYKNTLEIPDNVMDEFTKFKKAVTDFYARNDMVPIFFERNYKTSHMQLQAVPVPEGAVQELKEIFMEEAEGNGFQLNELEMHNRLEQVVQKNVPYFAVELPSGLILYCKIQAGGTFPINFGRDVLILGPVLNLPDRSEWKECVMKREDEESLVKRIRTDFQPYDFTI